MGVTGYLHILLHYIHFWLGVSMKYLPSSDKGVAILMETSMYLEVIRPCWSKISALCSWDPAPGQPMGHHGWKGAFKSWGLVDAFSDFWYWGDNNIYVNIYIYMWIMSTSCIPWSVHARCGVYLSTQLCHPSRHRFFFPSVLFFLFSLVVSNMFCVHLIFIHLIHCGHPPK